MSSCCKTTVLFQVYKAIHHVLVRYGKKFEDHIYHVAQATNIPADEVSRELESLYDKIRGIIIHDSTSVSLLYKFKI